MKFTPFCRAFAPFLFLIASVPFFASRCDAQPLQVTTANQTGRYVPAVAAPRTWFVNLNATGSNNGTSWTDAFQNLQGALAVAADRDEIWTAQGTYYPVAPGGPRHIAFSVRKGIAMYGGFDGTETQRNQRDISLHPTVLSGDINRDDVISPTYDTTTWNSYQVVTMWNSSASSRLDGFKVEGGDGHLGPFSYAEGNGVTMSGPGTVANCTFTHCNGDTGGAIWIGGRGGALIENCLFSDNHVADYTSFGGALYSSSDLLTVRGSTFINNSTEGFNSRTRGGAIYHENGTLVVDDCVFYGNRAIGFGNYTRGEGGAIALGSGQMRVTRCTFSRNLAGTGGAIACMSSTSTGATILNSLFVDNHVRSTMSGSGWPTPGSGGAVFGGHGTTVQIIGSTILNGSAVETGGALLLGEGEAASSIFWNNSDDNGMVGTSQVAAASIRYSCVMNLLVGAPGATTPDPADFPGCFDLDPLLAPHSFELLAGSPCIDAADNHAFGPAILTDLRGRPRFVDDPLAPNSGLGQGPIADMGSLERQ